MIKLLKKLFQTKSDVDTPKDLSSTELANTSINIVKPIEQPTKSKEKMPTFPFNVPIINDPTKREFNKGYRKDGDKENVIRLNQHQPKGCPKKVAEFIPIAGIIKGNREEGALEFIHGKNRSLELIKDPKNPYDKNAIEVHGYYIDENDNETSTMLGFVPAKNAKTLSKLEPLKATIALIYYPIESETVGIRIDIWGNANKRKKIEEKPYIKMDIPKSPVDRNLKGQELEKEGYLENAIEFYELNLKSNFDGNFPYDRLAIIYRRKKKYNEEIRVLEKAISVFEKLEETSPRDDVNPKLGKFKERLEKAKELSNNKQ